MRLIFLLLLSVVSYTASADDTLHTAHSNQPYNAVKLGATTISVLIPTVQLGFEHRWKRFSWQATAGFVVPKHYVIDDTIRGTALGYSLRIEGRIHKRNPSHSGVYLGFSFFYNWFKYPHVGYFSDSMAIALHTGSGIEDEYLLMKHTIGCVVQFGGHHYIGKHFDIEGSIGLGPKVMFTSQRGRTNPDDISYSRHPNLGAIESGLGTSWAMATQVQLSVGYILGD